MPVWTKKLKRLTGKTVGRFFIIIKICIIEKFYYQQSFV